MLNNKELQTIRQAIPYFVIENPPLAIELEAIASKYEIVRSKLRSKIAITRSELEKKRMEGLSYREIAKHFKCSITTIKRLLVIYKLSGIGGKQEFNYVTKKNQE